METLNPIKLKIEGGQSQIWLEPPYIEDKEGSVIIYIVEMLRQLKLT